MFGKKKNFMGLIFTFLGGVAAGAAVALLFAPMPGKKMQKKVVDKVEDLQDQMRRFTA